ncbi:MAG TPA: phosphonate ABC transporter, permease protein PhnE [Xanthobacteraceae bacterium]|jgi:phosphonate transport system permease protein
MYRLAARTSGPGSTPGPPHYQKSIKPGTALASRAKFFAGLIGAAAFLGWSANSLELSATGLAHALPVIGDYLARMIPPDWRALDELWGPTLDTICIAIWGIVIATLIGFPLGVLAARNLTSSRILRASASTMLNVLRSISELIWAVFFVAAVGLGPFPGALALGVNFGGILGRLYAEAIENIDAKPLEAMRATGAGHVQTILFAVLPQVMPQIVSYNLYWFEVGVRSATVLGMIGAGGIGFELVTTIRLYEFRATAAILLVILALVTLIDQASALVRRSIVK